jgi:hypothetical protein
MDTRAQERILIAKDALKWVKAGALIPMHNVYVGASKSILSTDFDRQLRDVVLGECKVCIKGALFLAKAVRFDHVLARELCEAGHSSDSPLNEHFDEGQLDLLERTFEGWSEWGTNEDEDIKKFAKRYPKTKDRLVAILENIIKNQGTFKL